EEPDDKVFAIKGIKDKKINLGWIMFDIISKSDIEINLPDKLQDKIKRIAIVSDYIFSQLANDNLEVRTSVKIDYQTGAAEPGGLFTYEAIPRGSVFGFELMIDERRQEDSVNLNPILKGAFDYIKLLGIGGMGTRGFGRVSFFSCD
ncbi:MAG TPA: RAMP superfamily CRISPR-associated protein, partial [Halanaerobiales bacterium]|nr:RAMP superfamily CRISPR-associated protein [Halanaerobiales bacterium]